MDKLTESILDLQQRLLSALDQAQAIALRVSAGRYSATSLHVERVAAQIRLADETLGRVHGLLLVASAAHEGPVGGPVPIRLVTP